jgi:hypothetical protein
MGIKNGGYGFDLANDSDILSINSPQKNVGGPYVVVHKDMQERWVIVAMDWDKKPVLGMRWFWGDGGNPRSTTYSTWLVIPSSLNTGILSSLSLGQDLKSKVEDFLSGKIIGNELKK